jgi:hypothetical protein
MKRILFVVVMATVFFAATGVANAQTTRIDFTGSEWCDPDTFLFGSAREAGPNLLIRGITQVCYDSASIPQLTGTDFLSNASLQLIGTGPNFILTGKLRMESAEGGVWVGSWVLPANTNTIMVIAHGEGLYNGMQLHWFLTEDGPFWGYILNPGN